MTISNSPARLSTYAPVNPNVSTLATTESRGLRRESPQSLAADGDSRAKGDSALAQNYGAALAGFTGTPANDNSIMVEVPPDSTFGQWWTQLGKAAQSGGFVEWRRYVRALPGSIKILPTTGQVIYRVTPDVSRTAPVQMRGSEDLRWSAARGPLVDAGRVISGGNGPLPLPSPEHPNRAPAWVVGRFYYERVLNTPAEFQQRSAAIERDKTFEVMDPVYFSGVHAQRSQDALDNQKTLLGDLNNRHDAAVFFKHLDSVLAQGNLELSEIPRYLRVNTFTAHPDSSYERERVLPEGGSVSLQDFLESRGLDIPHTADDVANLKTFLMTPTPQGPVHGNGGGALSWPRPLEEDAQRQLFAFLHHDDLGALNLGTRHSVLESLMQGVEFQPSELRNPQQVIDRLIQSPQGQALGETIKARFEALSVTGSVNDWLMAALSLDYTTAPARSGLPQKHVAGFDLAGQQLKGQPLSQTRQRVADHLYLKARQASSPEKALIQAHLMLASRAPELLVKDTPPTVTHGSHAHVSFSTAVARIEAETPGRAATMSYGEVMLYADIRPVSKAHRQIEYVAHHEALKEWGITNNIVASVASPADMNKIEEAYNEQLTELRNASEAQSTAVPPSRREIALADLRKLLGNDMRLELKCIVLATYDKDRPGPYSILDLYIENRLQNPPMQPYHPRAPNRSTTPNRWALESYTPPHRGPGRSEASTPNFTIDDLLSKTRTLKDADVNKEFYVGFAKYGHALDKSVATHVKNLIAQLPLEDRKNIEYGRLSIFREFKGVPRVGQGQAIFREPSSEGSPVLLKLVRDGAPHTYELNVQKNTLHKRRDLGDFQPGYQGGEPRNEITPYTDMVPVTLSTRDEGSPRTREMLAQEKTDTGGPLNSFSSPRTAAIGATVAKVTSFWQALESEARGLTTVESEVPFYKTFNEFALNLLPLRSAIKNFIDGNIGEGIIDLSLDVFGVLTVGAAASWKGANSALSAGGKALRITKTLGLSAISLINPLDGVTDLLRGIGRGALSVGKRVIADAVQDIRMLRGATKNYDVVCASKQFEGASVGTFKLNNDFSEGPAVFKNNNWYAYNPVTRQPYGPALKEFLPSARTETEQLGKWATAADPSKKIDDAIANSWKSTVSAHRNGVAKADFDKGYNYGDPKSVKGLSNSTKIEDLMKLAGNKRLTAEQVGILVRRYDDIALEFGRQGSARFIDAIEPYFGEVIPMPQVIYLSRTSQLSDGQCAALSRVMATAMAEGKEHVLIKNMFSAAAFPKDPASREFIAKLSRIQNQAGSQSAFHAGKPIRQLSVKNMVKELADSTASKSIMIDSPGHAMAAGVKIDGVSKKYYFYDPNHGLATFSRADAMDAGLKKLFLDKKLIPQYKTHSTGSTTLEFKVFDHDDAWQERSSVFSQDVRKLFEMPIAPKPASSAG